MLLKGEDRGWHSSSAANKETALSSTINNHLVCAMGQTRSLSGEILDVTSKSSVGRSCPKANTTNIDF